jgi:hypothetical protein
VVSDGGQSGCLTGGQSGWPDRGGQTGWPDGGPDGAGRGARWGPDGVPDGWPHGVARRGPDGGPTGPDRVPDGPDGVADGRNILLLKEKMTCSVYVSCKSSSASDVSDVGWM